MVLMGECLLLNRKISATHLACRPALLYTKMGSAPLGAPVLAGFRREGKPECRDCCMFKADDEPLGLAIRPIDDRRAEGR